MVKKILLGLLALILVIGTWITVDFLKNDKIEKIPAKPSEANGLKPLLPTSSNQFLLALENEEDFPEENLESILYKIDSRYDCADFEFVSLMRIMYKYGDQLPQEQYDKIKESILNFKYWMDQPGEDSMCFWSENHQILFATAEYLAGHMFKDEIFTNDGKTGAEHSEMAKERMNIWFDQRFKYGFTEWYSNTYYVEDVGPLANLIDFAPDEEIRKKATIIMDLLLYDLATQSYKGALVSSSGRAYEGGRKSGVSNSMRSVAMDIWPEYEIGDPRSGGMDVNFLLIENYEVPEVIRDIGLDNEDRVIKATNGLNVSELKERDLIGEEDNQIMMQWAMESFTNPEIITNTMNYIHKNDMLSNEFLNDFKMINIGFLKRFNLLPTVSKILNPMTNGVAIQRANTYTYKTDDYMMATAQNYHPGDFGDQQHIWTATLGYDFNVFTTHPAKPLGDGALGSSPNYWVGYGRLPHSMQDENVNLSIYEVKDEKGFMEDHLSFFTHAYFPQELFDNTIIKNNIAVGEYGNGYIALIGKNDLVYKEGSTDDLIQDGSVTYWICELGSKDDYSSINKYYEYISGNEVTFSEDKLQLVYENGNKTFDLTFKGDFLVNDEIIETEHKRFDASYSNTEREPKEILIEFKGKSLLLDLENNKRIVSN